MELFRKEVLEERDHNNYGQVRRVLSGKYEFILCLIFALLIVIFLFTTRFDYSRKLTIRGYVHPNSGVVKVYSPSDGYIRSKFITEGASVINGVPLVKIDSYTSILSGRDNYRKYIKLLKDQLDYIANKRKQEKEFSRVTINSVLESIESNRKALKNLNDQVSFEREKKSIVYDRNNKYRKVYSKGYLSNEKIKEKKLDELNIEKSISELMEKIDFLESNNKSLKRQMEIIKIENARNLNVIDIEYSKKRMEILDLESMEGTTINSKLDGKVSDVNFEIGQEVKKNDYLMSILPIGTKLEVTLMVPSTAYSFIDVGDKVHIKVSAFPFEKYGVVEAEITTKSDTISLPSEVKIPIGMNEGFYRVIASLENEKVTFNDENYSIKPGMLVDADVITEKKKISEWLLSPFYEVITKSKK